MEVLPPVDFLLHRLAKHPKAVTIHAVKGQEVVLLKSEFTLYCELFQPWRANQASDVTALRAFTRAVKTRLPAYRHGSAYPSVINVPSSGNVADLAPEDMQNGAPCTCRLGKAAPETADAQGVVSCPNGVAAKASKVLVTRLGQWVTEALKKVKVANDIDELRKARDVCLAQKEREQTELADVRVELKGWRAKLTDIIEEHSVYFSGVAEQRQQMARREADLENIAAELRGKEAAVQELMDRVVNHHPPTEPPSKRQRVKDV